MDLSEDLEVDFDVHLHWNRMAALHGRLEAILSHRVDCLLVQTHADAAQDVHILRHTARVHDQIDQHDAHELRLTGFLAEFRIDLKDQLWLRDAATNMADSAAVVAARTRLESRA